MLVNENTVDHCLVMFVHSVLTKVKQLYYFINALVNAEINIKINKCCRSIVLCSCLLMNLIVKCYRKLFYTKSVALNVISGNTFLSSLILSENNLNTK